MIKKPFRITPEDLQKKTPMPDTDYFSPNYQHKTHEEIEKLNAKVTVIKTDKSYEETIRDDLITLGYSGHYKIITDGTIDKIVPVNIFGMREDV